MKKLAVLLVVGALALSACGGSDDDDNAGSGSNPTTPGGNDNGDDNGGNDYKALLEKAKQAKLRVTYETNTTDADAVQVMTVSSNGEGKLAYFLEDGDTHAIAEGETYTICTDVKTEPECQTLTGGIAAAGISVYAALLSLPSTVLSNYSGDYGSESSEEIAGRDARCVTFDYLGGEWKSCADKETGVGLLWAASVAGQGGSFRATEAGDPLDSDFEPDAEPTTISIPDITLPGGGTIPGIPGG